MNLEEFVKVTLIDITRAVKNANIELSKEYGETETVAYYRLTESDKKDDIAFDVAVTAATQLSGQLKGKMGISVVSVDSNVDAAEKSECVSRIKFKIQAWKPIA